LNQEIVQKITGFVKSTGLEVVLRPIHAPTFLPGLLLENGKIIIDTDKLLHPGDILHEAGHLAGYPTGVRETIGDPLPEKMSGGLEMMAMAWSYAAALHIGLDPSVVFHDEGYRGDSDHLLDLFKNGHYIGLNMLQYMGLAYDEKRSKELNVMPYPKMVRWLTDKTH
jgi:hypothetical protein